MEELVLKEERVVENEVVFQVLKTVYFNAVILHYFIEELLQLNNRLQVHLQGRVHFLGLGFDVVLVIGEKGLVAKGLAVPELFVERILVFVLDDGNIRNLEFVVENGLFDPL